MSCVCTFSNARTLRGKSKIIDYTTIQKDAREDLSKHAVLHKRYGKWGYWDKFKNFLRKIFRARHRQKRTICTPLDVFAYKKLFFVRLILSRPFVSDCSVRKKLFWNCLNSLIYYTKDVNPLQPLYGELSFTI